MDKILILSLLEYLVRVLVLLIGGGLLAFVRKYRLEKWVRVGVSAAEQMKKEGLINIPKKEYVIQLINDRFRFKINENELNALIEAAVYEMNLLKELNDKPTQVLKLN